MVILSLGQLLLLLCLLSLQLVYLLDCVAVCLSQLVFVVQCATQLVFHPADGVLGSLEESFDLALSLLLFLHLAVCSVNGAARVLDEPLLAFDLAHLLFDKALETFQLLAGLFKLVFLVLLLLDSGIDGTLGSAEVRITLSDLLLHSVTVGLGISETGTDFFGLTVCLVFGGSVMWWWNAMGNI